MGLKIFTIKFRRDLLLELWEDFEISMNIDDVIAKFKSVTNKLELMEAVGMLGHAIVDFSKAGEQFLTDPELREEAKNRCDKIIEFGGTVGSTIGEMIDGMIIGWALNWIAEPVEIEEE